MISMRKAVRVGIILLGTGVGLLGSRDIVGHFLGGSGGTTISLIDTVRADVPESGGGVGVDGGDGGGADCP